MCEINSREADDGRLRKTDMARRGAGTKSRDSTLGVFDARAALDGVTRIILSQGKGARLLSLLPARTGS